MKKILVTGAGSYIGESFGSYVLASFPGQYTVDYVDMTDPSWSEKDFSRYDSVVHVAGIAHRKETSENAQLYYDVNRDLAVRTAEKAKNEGVGQFIMLSTMSVYGTDTGVITPDTAPAPVSNYGKSKLEAERAISALSGEQMRLCIVRPPMVYGKDCKGNFQTVVSMVRKLPAFPKLSNRRSMIYIDNLSEFLRIAVEENLGGVYMPQNREYVCTSDMAAIIADTLGRKVLLSRLLGLGVCMVRPFVSLAKKAFGSLIYKDTERLDYRYCVVEQKESFRRSV